MSINVWPQFEYESLFDYASQGGLADEDLPLFDETTNFERVLADLNTAIRVAGVCSIDPAPFFDRYRSVQQALGHAIRQVHPHRLDVPNDSLGRIRAELTTYEWIFTTSYDVLIYWAMGYGESFPPFMDHFRNCVFNPRRTGVNRDQIPVYFLHGALHLVVGGDGITRKIKRTGMQTLLDQFGEPIEGDPQARPLLVTEGSARDKLLAIEGNDYLSHTLDVLGELDLPLVVFGSRLGREDQHLVDVLNENVGRPVAVSLYPAPRRELAVEQAEIYGRLRARTLLFFDATTHPLGTPDLRAPIV